jgi:hypothetical protein
MNLQGFTYALKKLFDAPHQVAMRDAFLKLGDEYRQDANLRWFAAELAKLKPENEKRTNEQNRKLWGMLKDISEQVIWHGNKLADHEWKDVLTAGLKRQKVAPGIDGGFVVLGAKTSKMTKSEFSELVEMLYHFGAQQGVKWTDPVENEAAT